MALIRSTFILLSVLIAVIHCSVVVRRDDEVEIDPLELIRDNYGCDALVKSCGNKGACCDVHDACYRQHGCKSISWLYLWGNCRSCNLAVMGCVARRNPGKSSCCEQGNCGQPRP